MPIQQNCKITGAGALEPYGYFLTLEAGELAKRAVPGQFVHLHCGGDTFLRRPFGICAVEGDQLRLTYELRGTGTEALSERRAGEGLDVLGPLGRGFDLSGERLLLAGGGMGCSPLLFCAAHLGGRSDAVLGFRSAQRSLLTEEFRALCARVEVCTDDGSLGEHAFVDALVRNCLARERYDRVLTCGPAVMMRAVAAAAQEAGVPCQVSLEARMGCGVGACLVCACKKPDGGFAHVCKDGPVFDAGEVVWDA